MEKIPQNNLMNAEPTFLLTVRTEGLRGQCVMFLLQPLCSLDPSNLHEFKSCRFGGILEECHVKVPMYTQTIFR